MKIALIQEHQNNLYLFHADGISYSREEALHLQEEMIKQNIGLLQKAADSGADIAVTSEAINFPGVPHLIESLNAAELVGALQDFVCSSLSNLAKDAGMNIVAGMLRIEDGHLFNEAVVFDRSGREVHVHKKVFLTQDEQRYMTSGAQFRPWESEFGRIGIAICWDMQFPESCRSYVVQDCPMVLAPTWGWERSFASARAYENGMVVGAAMAVPAYKPINGLRLPSQVILPDSTVLVQGPCDASAVVIADIEDLDAYRDARLPRANQLKAWLAERAQC